MKICNEPILGDLVLSADFSATGPTDDLAEVYPRPNITDIHEAATFQTGTAILHSNGSNQEADVTPVRWFQATPPPDLVAVVDFKSLSPNSTLGFSPRCTKDACILLAINGDGKYSISVRKGSSWSFPLTGDLNGDTGYPAPRLDPTGENRLIVWLSHDQIGGSLNGRLLGTLDVTARAIQEAFVFYRGLSQNQPTQVALTRIYFFAARP